MKKLCGYGALFIGFALLFCGNYPSDSSVEKTGELRINTRIEKTGASLLAKSAQTTWDSLIIQISSADMNTIRHSTKLLPAEEIYSLTLQGIPAGENRLVEAWTVNRSGQRIHYGSELIDINAGETKSINLWLAALRGSIYIQLADVPRTVDSIFVVFAFEDTLSVKARRSTSALVNLSIDNIPDGAHGYLKIFATDTLRGDTIYASSQELIFHVNQLTTIDASFSGDPGEIEFSVAMEQPGVTLIPGSLDSTNPIDSEVGPLIISEIMYKAGDDSDYVELFNTAADTFKTDTLILDIIGSTTTTKYLRQVKIDPHGFYVIGDQKTPKAWDTDTTVNIDLTITGKWVVIKNKSGEVIDWVSYCDNDLEWPSCDDNYALELDSLAVNAEYNNYGRNWKQATALIAGQQGYWGTPGK